MGLFDNLMSKIFNRSSAALEYPLQQLHQPLPRRNQRNHRPRRLPVPEAPLASRGYEDVVVRLRRLLRDILHHLDGAFIENSSFAQ